MADQPTETQVREQLVRVCANTVFARSPKMKEFLTYVVEARLEGRGGDLKGYTIGLEVFDRPVDHDPIVDSIVRVQAGKLRSKLEQYYRQSSTEDQVRISMPTGAYVPEFEILQAPEQMAESAGRQSLSARIAILPITFLGFDADLELLSASFTEEVIYCLSRFREFSVLSRWTTRILLSESQLQWSQVRALEVSYVVEGSVTLIGDQYSAIVDLIEVSTGDSVLTERITGPVEVGNFIDAQQRIAQLIAVRIGDPAGALSRKVVSTPKSARPTDWNAFDWLARFYEYKRTLRPELHKEARDGIFRFLETNANWANGCAALSMLLLDERRLHFNERADVNHLEQALQFAARAVESDPENALSHCAQALSLFFSGDLVGFRLAAERALELNPGHAQILADLGMAFAFSGDTDHGLALTSRAIELCPAHPGWFRLAIVCKHLLDGESEAALAEVRKGWKSGYYWQHALFAWCEAEAGNWDAAKSEVLTLLSMAPNFENELEHEMELFGVSTDLNQQTVNAIRQVIRTCLHV